MKTFNLIILAFILVSCNNQNANSDELIFNVRKHIIKEAYRIDNLDLKTLKIDSVKDYPKYLYLENELSLLNSIVDNQYEALDNKNKNEFIVSVINNIQSQIDSLEKEYDKTSKKEIYYKCYASVRYIIPDTLDYCLKYATVVENCVVRDYSTDLLIDENFDVIKTLFELQDELEPEG